MDRPPRPSPLDLVRFPGLRAEADDNVGAAARVGLEADQVVLFSVFQPVENVPASVSKVDLLFMPHPR